MLARGPKPRIAVFAGPTATVMNSAPLITSNQARERHNLPLLTDEWGAPLTYDVLRPQRLATAVTVYVEQFSAHPLERDAAELYGPPDGYVNAAGEFYEERREREDIPVYKVVLRPEDGPIPLPYMARTADGGAWEGDCATSHVAEDNCRQPFYPDASRIFQEIDRLGVDERGRGNLLSSQADYDYIRVLPSGGYRQGLSAPERTDAGVGEIAREELGRDFWPYRPAALRREPPRPLLARVTNRVQEVLSRGEYEGGLWLDGSPQVEETAYWLNLLIDTTGPIIGCSSPDWPHGVLASSGDRNLVDAVRYIRSRIWADSQGRDRIGVVVIQAERVFTSREVQKVDSRAGGYIAAGGHGGIVASMGEPGPPVLTFVPARRHTHCSLFRVSKLPRNTLGVRQGHAGPVVVEVVVKDEAGRLSGDAIPHVSIVSHGRYLTADDSGTPESEPEILARIDRNLRAFPLAGFVAEGGTPYAVMSPNTDAALRLALFSGMPVVRVGRGAGGFVPAEKVSIGIAGGNLTATKARVLLMACLLRFGALPPAADPRAPTEDEIRAVQQAIRAYQDAFDRH